MKIRDIIISKLLNLYTGAPSVYLRVAREVIQPDIPAIVDCFYREAQEVEEIAPILSHALVERNLHHGLERWLNDLFSDQRDIDAFVIRQIEVGRRHAEININLHYVNHGLRILKREIYSRLESRVEERELLFNTGVLVDELFDIVSSLMSDSYFESLVKHETNALSLRMNALSRNPALEFERLRGLLLDWSREALSFLIQEERVPPENALYLQYSEFGLWLEHKGDLILPGREVVERLQGMAMAVDMEFSQAATYRFEGDQKNFRSRLRAMNDRIVQTSWHLAVLVDQAVVQEVGRDPLTNLYNRRFLETVLRRETEIAMRQGFPYAVLMIDLDHFKRVNDTYGHGGGDAVLRQFAEQAMRCVRASDFLFRYGGEEFLSILVNVTPAIAMQTAEKIRRACESHSFLLPDGRMIQVTCSIGGALHDGHPDYNRLSRRADEALYQAKQEGRNRSLVR